MAGLEDITKTKFSKWQIAAVGVGGAAVTYFAWKQHQSSVAAAATTPSDMSAADQLASSGTDLSGYYGGSGNYPPGTIPPVTSVGTQTGYPDDATWSQAAVSGLSDIGYSPTDVATAIGDYLAGLTLTSAQATIVRVALSEYGSPPSGLLPVKTAPSAGPTPTTKPPAVPTGFSVTPHPGYADFGWGNVAGATYELVVTGAGGKGTGTSHFDQSVTDNHVEHLTLDQGKYVATVRAKNSAGVSAYTPRKTFTVTK